MKKPILIALLLAGSGLLAGCVNPGDLTTVAPPVPTSTKTPIGPV